MRKRKPTHDLDSFKAVVAKAVKGPNDGGVIAGSALVGARSIGFGVAQMARTIAALDRRHFRESVTSHANSKEWQDVYHFPHPDGLVIYIKFRSDVVCEFRLLSFKDRDGE